MRSINVVAGRQTWEDLAIQGYGNVDALQQLMTDNVLDDTETDLADPVALASVSVNESSPLVNAKVLSDNAGAVIATVPTLADYDSDDYDPEDYDA